MSSRYPIEVYSHRTTQAVALASLGADHLTLSGSVLDQLAALDAAEIKLLPAHPAEIAGDLPPRLSRPRHVADV